MPGAGGQHMLRHAIGHVFAIVFVFVFAFGAYRNSTSFPMFTGTNVFVLGAPRLRRRGGPAFGGNPGQLGPAGLTGDVK